jgi:hypothetical protein
MKSWKLVLKTPKLDSKTLQKIVSGQIKVKDADFKRA